MFIDYLLEFYGAKKQKTATDSVIATDDEIDTHCTVSCSKSEDESAARQLVSMIYEKEEVDDCWRAKAIALSEEVSTLIDQLEEQNASLEQCQEMMERGEKIQGERVAVLEMQVARLIEMQNKFGRNQNIHHNQHRHFSSLPAPAAMKEDANCDTLHSAKLEISALEELLSRVLAERDFLTFRNKNLESLIKDVPDMKYARDKACRYYQHDGGPTGGIIYQLSCTVGTEKHAIIGMTDQDLGSKVVDQFKEVWKLVQNDTGRKDSGDCIDQTKCCFGKTQFAKHIAHHCRDATFDEEEVNEWCQRNVKVKILRIELD